MQKEILNDNTDITANSHQLELLKQNFPQCFDKDGNFIVHKMEEIVGESGLELSKESYSLNWLGKSYARLLANENPHTLLKENKEHNALEQNKESQNLLIKGDNLEVLKHLSNAYSESIKMIYIDPPYNTGSDGFVYNDDRKFKPEELSRLAGIDMDEANRILEFTQSNANSHSAWLTFMYPRLYVARHLLREDGIIFISIDDSEHSQLKLLCDEIYGEENFRGDIVRATGTTTGQNANKVGSSYDSVLSYSKSDSFDFGGIELGGKDLNRFNNDDEDGKGKYALLQLRKTGNADRKEDREGMFFPILSPDGTEVYPIGPTDYLSRWRVGKKTFNEMKDEGLIVWKKEDDEGKKSITISGNTYDTTWKPYVKYYLEGRTKKVSNLWTDIDGNKKGSIEIKDLFGSNVFTNPKPTEFLRRVLSISNIISGDIILDFFAGSGTTAHATMKYNLFDNVDAKYILIQIDELTDETSAAYKEGYKTIFEITKSRIEKAAAKIAEENPDYKGDLGFKIYETIPVWDGYLDEIEELKDNTALFDGSKLNDEELEILLTTWKVHDGMELSHELNEIDLAGYKGYLGEETLYFVHTGFTTEVLKKLIEKLDSDKTFEPSRIVLFGYNFASKHQREVGEALNSYANKKSIELDLIVRY
ncbi:MAG: hypothetical protein P794_09520 [Epsilonproteobacteria bacterium (ex Lamellibrachia satsuma)]|nr:MAG: hypothetical protein P794_09520 [Epsilonproteobacteria bacterium (ex Lamellibrachia satsuma)]